MFAAYPLAEIDWDSSSNHIRFMEDDLVMNNLGLIKSSCIILDINEFDLAENKFKPYGFAIYSLTRMF